MDKIKRNNKDVVLIKTAIVAHNNEEIITDIINSIRNIRDSLDSLSEIIVMQTNFIIDISKYLGIENENEI